MITAMWIIALVVWLSLIPLIIWKYKSVERRKKQEWD